jgi:hypothetical protein
MGGGSFYTRVLFFSLKISTFLTLLLVCLGASFTDLIVEVFLASSSAMLWDLDMKVLCFDYF